MNFVHNNVKLLFLLFYMLLLPVVICNKIVENILYNFVEFYLYDFNKCSCTDQNAPNHTKSIAAVHMHYYVVFCRIRK